MIYCLLTFANRFQKQNHFADVICQTYLTPLPLLAAMGKKNDVAYQTKLRSAKLIVDEIRNVALQQKNY